MAAPIAHIYTAYRYHQAHPVADLGEFLAGCVYPDIRLLNKTVNDPHNNSLRILENGLTAFELGMAHHAILDNIRRQTSWVQVDDVDRVQALKIFEDLVLAEEFSDLVEVKDLVTDPVNYPLPSTQDADLNTWIKLLRPYLAFPVKNFPLFIAGFGHDEAVVNRRVGLIKEFMQNPQLRSSVQAFYREFAGRDFI